MRRLTTVVVMCGVGCVGAFGSTMAWADTPPPCSVQGCTYGQGAGGSTPGSPQPPSGTHRGGGGSAGPTTCTATDFTKNPPQQVTGPISSKPAFGTGGEWQYPEGPAVDPPGPNGETSGGRWYIVYCGGVSLDMEWVPDGSSPTGTGGASPAAVADAALAHLPLHAPTININPDPSKTDALVGLPTWFWVNDNDVGTFPAGASQGSVSVAGSVTADHIVVDPGDNTGTFTCPGTGTEWQQGATQTNCSHTYARSSAGKGTNNDYIVTVTVVWAGNYTATVNGVTVPGGGLGPVQEQSQRPIRVAEQQAINTP